MNYCRSCLHSSELRVIPTTADAEEFLRLKREHPSCLGDVEERKKHKKLLKYENCYDWRPQRRCVDKCVGLISPSGRQLLPDIFADVFTQFNTMESLPDFIPVSNGDGWALASIGSTSVLMTEFQYNAIIPERWERKMFFVQDKVSMKWGALRTIYQSTNCMPQPGHHYLSTIESIMPCIADEIYEDELLVDDPDEFPSLFFMTRIGDKVGILTDFGYSPIIYDSYVADARNCSFRLIRKDRKRATRADWWNPCDTRNIEMNS